MTGVGFVWIGGTKTDLLPNGIAQYQATVGENAMRGSSVVIDLFAGVTIH